MKIWTRTSMGFSLTLLALGCHRGENPNFLGSAHIEADHYTLAPSIAGTLVSVTKQQGDSVQLGEVLAIVDTMPLHWQREELIASHVELQASVRAKAREVAAIKTEAGGVERDLNRISPLVKTGSAPEQQEDRLRTSLTSARERQQAAQAGAEGLQGRQAALTAKLNWLDEQLQRCIVRSPVSGIIITRYRNQGEMTSPAQPIFELSRGDTLRADFYLPQTFLADLRLGSTVFLRLDQPQKSSEYIAAHVAYISDEAEFAPKNTQTRESRNELVFQVRALAANNHGQLKRGLPVEIWKDTTEAR